jgi:hypothetical protein
MTDFIGPEWVSVNCPSPQSAIDATSALPASFLPMPTDQSFAPDSAVTAANRISDSATSEKEDGEEKAH